MFSYDIWSSKTQPHVRTLSLCAGTFFYQKHRRDQKDKEKLKNPKETPIAEILNNNNNEIFDRNLVKGMGKDGLDNLQTVKLNEMSPLPLPRTESVTKTADKTSSMSKRDPSARYSDMKLPEHE